jgi:putative DNA primase/helicase
MKDWNDALKAGVSIRELADQAWTSKSADAPEPAKPKQNEVPFKLTCLADVEAAEINWLWPNYLARGKLTLLGGDPDLGKSQLTIDAAARQSKGAHWPFGPHAHIASTIFLCSEDGIADTVKPRAEAAGANVSLLHVFSSTLLKGGKLSRFTLGSDLDMLGIAIKRVSAALVCIDAITSYMGKIENNSTPDVRAVLDPIADWAEAHKVAVLGVTHPPKAAQKNAIRQFTGSFAYVAAARLAFYVTKEPDSNRTLLLSVKNNIGQKALGRAYRIAIRDVSHGIVAPYIQWDDAPVDYTADQAIAANNVAMKGGSAMDDAKDFLREFLKEGPADAEAGTKAAKAQGISERTLYRARKALGVEAKKDGYQGEWKWHL